MVLPKRAGRSFLDSLQNGLYIGRDIKQQHAAAKDGHEYGAAQNDPAETDMSGE